MVRRNSNINIQSQLDAVNNYVLQAQAFAQSAQTVSLGVSSGRPESRAVFSIDASNSRYLDSRILFTRNSIGSYIDKFGIIRFANANQPRFNHNPVTGVCEGLLIEPSRVNLLTYSENFLDASWIKSAGASVTPVLNSVMPSPANTACFQLNDGSNANTSAIAKNVTLTDTTEHVFFAFVKYGTIGEGFKIQVVDASDNSKGVEAYFNLLTGVKLNASVTNNSTAFVYKNHSIKAYKNGWYRVDITFTSTLLNVTAKVIPQTNDHTALGGQYIYIYACQLQKGFRSSTYIQTSSTPVTRDADKAEISGNNFTSFFPDMSQGSIFISAKKNYINGLSNNYILFSNTASPTQNYIRLIDRAFESSVFFEMWKDGAEQYQKSKAFLINEGDFFRACFAWKRHDSIAFSNGDNASNDNICEIPFLNKFTIASDVELTIESFQFYSTRLTNAELLKITTDSLVGKKGSQISTNSELGGLGFISPWSLLREKNRQEFQQKGTGVSESITIRRPYKFNFEIVESNGFSITSQPDYECLASTDYTLTFNGAVGKTLTIAITPVFEY